MPAASLRALLTRAIDYAGLFPPASLELQPAMRNYAQYTRGPDVWMLGPFILPVAQFDTAAREIAEFDKAHPLRVSALGPRTDNADVFIHSLAAAMDAKDSFAAICGDAASVEQFEMPLPGEVNVDLLQAIRSHIDPRLATFWEAPANKAAEVIEVLAKNNSHNPVRTKLGFKLRTGGVTAEAFPSSGEIATVLLAAGNQQVPIKFTAGLHHPVRLFHKSVGTKMHGFLNVLGAGVLALEHQWEEADIVRMLDDEDRASFAFKENSFSWQDWVIPVAKISVRRELVTSLGSCSFDEPRDDLRVLKLL
jgi:hypothetical protein